MPGFEAGDIVRVPFPYTDRDTEQRRPALVVSDVPLGTAAALLWVLMITSAENRSWPGDVPIGDYDASGLPVASIVRTAKIATIEADRAVKIGRLNQSTWDKVRLQLAVNVGLG